MQDFIATYGLWILIILALVAIAAFLLRGKGRDKSIAASPPPVVSPPEVPVAEPLPAPSPAVQAASVTEAEAPAPKAPAVAGEPDNLLKIKGIGPKVNGILNGLGITRFDQIAAWTPADIARIDGHLGNFAGRAVRDQWVDQAGYLARGDVAGFEAKYGKL